MSEDDSTKDRATGLLHREAFLDEVRAAKRTQSGSARRGCLLVMHFPVLKQILKQYDSAAAIDALNSLLAFIETRLRSRDTLGRIGENSVCLLLRNCRESDALRIAEQYSSLVRNVVLEPDGGRMQVDVHYRVISLDSRGGRSRKGLSRRVKATDISETSKKLSGMSSQSRVLDEHVTQVVPLNVRRNETDQFTKASDAKPVDEDVELSPAPVVSLGSGSVVSLYSASSSAETALPAMRLKPGLLLNQQSATGSFRVQSVGVAERPDSLESSVQIAAVLNVLACNERRNAKPLIDKPLIVQLDASSLSVSSANWLIDQCREKQVAPSVLCLALRIESINQDLRNTLPALRHLNRLGIKMMLEGVSSAMQYSTLYKLADFDFLMISARALQASLDSVRTHKELEALIREVRGQQCQLCATGIDSAVLLKHARALTVDMGFGRLCGRTVPFPGESGSTPT